MNCFVITLMNSSLKCGTRNIGASATCLSVFLEATVKYFS